MGGGGGGGGRQIWWKIIKLRMRMRLSLFFFSERMKDIIQNESCCHRWLFSNLYIWNRFGRKIWDGYIKSRWLTLTRQTSMWRKSISTYRIYKWGTIKRTSFWAADPKGTMSYRTEGWIFRPSERANERTSERTNERTNVRPVPWGSSPPPPPAPQPSPGPSLPGP